MRTTLEIPDAIFRRAKARASKQGIPLSRFVTNAVAEKLNPSTSAKSRIGLVGNLRHLRKETARINQRIEQEFESGRHG